MSIADGRYGLGPFGPQVEYDPPFVGLGCFLSDYNNSLALEAILDDLRRDEHSAFADNESRLDREGDALVLSHVVMAPGEGPLRLAFDDFVEAATAFVEWMRSEPAPPSDSFEVVLAEWLAGQTPTARARRRLQSWLGLDAISGSMSNEAAEQRFRDAVAGLGGAGGIARALCRGVAERQLDARTGTAALAILGVDPFVALDAEARRVVGRVHLTRGVERRIDEAAKSFCRT